MRELRRACATVASRAQHVAIEHEAIPAYAASLPLAAPPEAGRLGGSREDRAAFWLTLDTINFGSGWFPTLRKRPGRSGYGTIAAGIEERFADQGAWSAAELAEIDTPQIAAVLGQDPGHDLMELFARALRDLGEHIHHDHGGSFSAVGGDSAVALAAHLGGWSSFADTSQYEEIAIPFLKRAQIAAADLARAGAITPTDLGQLTMFADNLVPHVLRLDGVLRYIPELTDRIDREELIEHGSEEEVEIRACALHAVELIVAERPGSCAADIDQVLWHRGGGPRYKAQPRHRSRCTAY